MKKMLLIVVTFVTFIALAGCEEDANPCATGTELVDGVCELIEDTTVENTEETNDDDETTEPVLTEVVCSNETGLHSVKGNRPLTISEWLNWTFLGGHLVTDPDNAWIMDYGAAIFNVKTLGTYAWEGSFTQSGMYLEAGCEYTFEFTLRTEAPNIKPDVIVFGENTSGVSFFEEVVELETFSNTYRFTVVPTTSDYVSTGVYFANSKGIIIIEEIDIKRNPIGTYSEVE